MGKFFLTYDELLKCIEIYKTDYPKQVEETLEIADQAIKALFKIPETMAADRWVDLGEPMDWLYNPTDDPEFTWILNRHDHMVHLGKAYLVTGKEIYAETFKKHILRWIEQNSVPTNITYEDATFFQKLGPWRLLEVGLRVQSWIWAYELMQKSPNLDETFLNAFFYSLSEHANYLCSYLGNTIINHATMHMQGLFMIGVVYDNHPRAAYWRQVALERLEVCMLHQINGDGVQEELSTHYHNASILFFGTPYLLAKKSGYLMSAWYEEKLKSMAAYTEATIRPDGISSPISDSNYSSEAFEYLGFIGLVLEDEHYTNVGHFTDQLLWLFGEDVYKKYKHVMGNKAVFNISKSFPKAGYYIMKDDNNYLFFDAAEMGGAHGHADVLSFEWMWKKQLIFSDPGCYTYEEGDWRRFFKGTKNHNTIAIDDMDQTEYLLSQKWGNPVAKPKLFRWINTNDYNFIDASHDGYQRLNNPVEHRRWLMQLKNPELIVIVDWLVGDGEHKIRQHFNLWKNASVNINSTAKTAEISYSSSDLGMNMNWYTYTGEKDDLTICEEKGWFSRKYAFKEEIPVINMDMSFKNKTGIVTICKPFDNGSNRKSKVFLEKVDIQIDPLSVDIFLLINNQKKKLTLLEDQICFD